MKTFHFIFVLAAFAGIIFLGCSQSLVGPNDQPDSINKKGPVIHQVQGSGLLFYDGKNLGARYNAREYADGTFDGEYEINCANATGDPTYKINGEVLSFTVYENANEFGGKLAVFFGQEKTGIYAGYYDLFFAFDNGQPGQATAPDQVNNWLLEFGTLETEIWGMTIGEWLASDPEYITSTMGILDCDKGNITIE